MKAVIIDDDKTSNLDLRQRLEGRSDISVEGVAYNGFDGLELINNVKPDVVFLDVELPDISGIDFISRSSYLQSSDCRIVLYTAHDKYTLQGLRKHVHDFLLKPIDPTDLNGVLERLNKYSNQENNERGTISKDNRFVLFTNSVDFTIIGRNDIGIFQYDSISRTWAAVVSSFDHPVKLRSKINGKAIMQLGKQYVQVHQKFIINLDYLINVENGKCHFFPPFDKVDYVTVGRVYKEKLLERFMSL